MKLIFTKQKPKKQNPRVAVATDNADETEGDKSKDGDEDGKEDENSSTVIGPVINKAATDGGTAAGKTSMQGPAKSEASSSGNDLPDIEVGAGGAWGEGEGVGRCSCK